MAGNISIREDAEQACRSLAYLIGQESDQHMKKLLFQDLVAKTASLRPEAKLRYLAEALAVYSPQYVQELVRPIMRELPSRKSRADVAIVTIIKPELIAVKTALGIPLNHRENREVNGLRYWECDRPSASGQDVLQVVVTMVGEARTLPCAIACERLFNTYDVGLCLLVGIAAGLRGKTELGDVIAATLVLDYEGQRLELDGAKQRPISYVPNPGISRDLQNFEPSEHNWPGALAMLLRHLKETHEVPELPEDWSPGYHHPAVVLAGEKLLADGSLPAMRETHHDKVRAAETEGSGFARACGEHSIPWLVFRGVSDFGDPDKPTSDRHQAAYALPVALAASLFIEHEYRQRERAVF